MNYKIKIIAAIAIMCMMCVACQKEGIEKTQEIYYQLNSEVEVDASGTEVLNYKFKYDENGNTVWEHWFDYRFNVTNDNTYDDQGRKVKVMSYDEENGKHELCYIEEYFYGPNYRILLAEDGNGTVTQKDSTVYDDKGNLIQYYVYYPDDESGELYLDFMGDVTNDQYGNMTKLVLSCPYDPDYYFEQRTQYEYKRIGEWNQYTSKEVKYTWDGEYFWWDNRITYEYDEYGNSICEVTYSANDYGNLERSYKHVYTVDTNLFTSTTYGTDYVPTQPNCYTQRLTYDASGNLIVTHTYDYSVHHKK